MKKFLLFSVFCFILQHTFAQKTDTLKYKQVLLISNNPDYYISDAEQELQQQNTRTPDQYRQYLRRSLDNKLAGAIGKLIPCYSLLMDTNRHAMESSWDFYNRSALTYKQPYGVKYAVAKKDAKKDKAAWNGPHDAPNYALANGAEKCLDNSVKDTTWLHKLANEYTSDLIVSINQFEIKTNYNSCLDIANRIYRRDVMVHYTILTAKGKSLQGNVAFGTFPSNDNRVEYISEKVFPDIAAYIATQVQGLLK